MLASAVAPSPAYVNGAVTVTTSLSVVASGSGQQTGSIVVGDGITNCTIVLPVTSCVFIPTAPGSKTLTASYADDSSFVGSTVPSVALTVQTGATQSVPTVAPSGTGSVTIIDDGDFVNCGATCSLMLVPGRVVHVAHRQDARSKFPRRADLAGLRRPRF